MIANFSMVLGSGNLFSIHNIGISDGHFSMQLSQILWEKGYVSLGLLLDLNTSRAIYMKWEMQFATLGKHLLHM